MSGGGTSNLQGGAIYANSDGGTPTITISDSTFEANEAAAVSVDDSGPVLRNL